MRRFSFWVVSINVSGGSFWRGRPSPSPSLRGRGMIQTDPRPAVRAAQTPKTFHHRGHREDFESPGMAVPGQSPGLTGAHRRGTFFQFFSGRAKKFLLLCRYALTPISGGQSVTSVRTDVTLRPFIERPCSFARRSTAPQDSRLRDGDLITVGDGRPGSETGGLKAEARSRPGVISFHRPISDAAK